MAVVPGGERDDGTVTVTFRYAVTDAVYGLDGNGRLRTFTFREGETADLPADVAEHFERRGYTYPRDNPAPGRPDSAVTAPGGQPEYRAKWVSDTRPHGWPPNGVDPGYTSGRPRRHPDYEDWRPE